MSGYGKQILIMSTIAIVLVVGVGLGVYLLQPQVPSGTSSSSTSVSKSSSTSYETSSVSTETANSCTSLIVLNGSEYCSFDATNITTIESPGFATMDPTIRFMNVTFRTTCQAYVGNCGPQSSTRMYTGAIEYNLTFSDGSSEVITNIWNGCSTTYLLSTHENPSAGFYLKCISNKTQEILLIVQRT
jgi:hypothetical protein